MEDTTDKPNFVEKDYSPFGGEFVRTIKGHSSGDMDLIRLKNGRQKVIRSNILSVGPHRSLEDVKKASERLMELTKFGINLPDFSIVLAANQLDKNPKYKSNTKNNLYAVVDFVDGINLEEAPDEIREQVDHALRNYSEHCRLNGIDPLHDIYSHDQYMYGSINGGPKKPYLVEIDLTNIPEMGILPV